VDYCYSIDITSDGDFILGGLTNATAIGDFDMLVMKVSDTGNEVWTKNVGLDGNEYSTWTEQTGDGGYIFAGYSNSFGSGDNDAYIVKLAPDVTTGFKNNIDQQSGFKLWSYPNPFYYSTTITFSATQESLTVDIEIYNEKGQTMRTFSNLRVHQSAYQQITWNGTDQFKQAVSPGMYFAILTHNGKTLASTKMILM
jgi:hypothetical protein